MPGLGETRSPAAPGRLATPLAVAHWCVSQGWPVHPLAPGRKTPTANCPGGRGRSHGPKRCPCLPAGRPCHGFHAATTDRQRIDAWWGSSPSSGVGTACGPADLIVIDIDAHAAEVPDRSRLLPGITIPGAVNLTGLASDFDTLALLAAFRKQPDPAHDESTLRVRTPSGCLHVWYRAPHPDIRLRCPAGSSPKAAPARQVDVRAEGGYIVAPTTRTAQGTYRPEGAPRMPAPLPQWLYAELIRTGHVINPPRRRVPVPHPRRGRSSGGSTAPHRVLDPLIGQVAQCAVAPEGCGFTGIPNRAAYTAGGLAAAGHVQEADARAQLLEAARQARSWQTLRNEKIIDDGLAAGAVRPFHLEGRS